MKKLILISLLFFVFAEITYGQNDTFLNGAT